ncbi:MAG TPA: DAK2 domain-containing protein, partial [Bacillales bacterium]|nr:DAK2 domain-containing protein [Bacillales bacterium]
MTVAKDAAGEAVKSAAGNGDFESLLKDVVSAAQASLKKTPDLLPVLKEVGVVDSGGQGLVAIYEGFVEGLTGEVSVSKESDGPSMDEMINAVHHKKAQAHIQTEDIKYGYCTEFMVALDKKSGFDESSFRNELDKHGDSLLVVSDPELVKVHIHTEKPGEMLSKGQALGELVHIKIDNMRRQHRDIISGSVREADEAESETDEPGRKTRPENEAAREQKEPFGIVAVAAGEGLKELMQSFGGVKVIEGGQTMNPSTEDLVSAIQEMAAEHVFILPNNGNIVLTAQQAAEVTDKPVTVIPAKSIPEGIAALVAFNPVEDAEVNERRMAEAASHVKSGQVTFAVRDTKKDGFTIEKDDFLAIQNGKIVAT